MNNYILANDLDYKAFCERCDAEYFASIEAQPVLMPGALTDAQVADMRATNPVRANFIYCDALAAVWAHAQTIEPLAGCATFDSYEDCIAALRENWAVSK